MLAKNVIYNAIGAAAPLVVSLATIPLLLGHIGAVRYGIVALSWLLFGYFGFFDLGLSQATANRLALPANQSPPRQAELFCTALLVNSGLGVLAGLVFYGVGWNVVPHIPQVPEAYLPELLSALPWIACLLPISTVSAVFIGAVESRERFLELNLYQIIGSVLNQALPLLAAVMIAARIDVVIAATALTRMVAAIPIMVMAIRQFPGLRLRRPNMSTLKDLFSYGGWVSATNIVSPILVSADQLLIGGMIGVGAVPSYSIPFSISTKVLLIAGAVSRAIFPRLTKLSGLDALRASESTAVVLSAVLVCVCAPAMILSELAFRWWLGEHYTPGTGSVAVVLLLGVWVNGIAFMPFSLLQSQDRPDVTARLHMIELIPFLVLLWLGISWLGLLGAAMAWTFRVLVDACILFRLARYSKDFVKRLWPSATLLLAAFAFATILTPATGTSLLAALVALALGGGMAMRRLPNRANSVRTDDIHTIHIQR